LPDVKFTRIEARTMPQAGAKDILEPKPTYSYDLTFDETNIPQGKRLEFIFQLSSKPEVVYLKMEGGLTIEGSETEIQEFLTSPRGGVSQATQLILCESLGIAISLAQILGVPRPTLPLNLK